MSEPPREAVPVLSTLVSSKTAIDYVVGDLACKQCGYNLRTLVANAVCPECGTPVQDSIRNFLRFADPRWVRGLAVGLLLLLISIGATVFVVPAISLGFALPTILNQPQPPTFPLDLFGPLALARFILNGLASVVALIGLILLSRRDPEQAGRPEGFTARRAIRLGCLLLPLTFAGGVVLALNMPFTSFTPGSPPAAVFSPAFTTFVTLGILVGVVSLAVFSFVTLALLRHLGTLLRRIPRPGLVRFARIEFWGLLICTVLLTCMYALFLVTIVPMVTRMAATVGPPATSAPWTVTATPAAVPVPINVMNIGGTQAPATTQPASASTPAYELVVPGGNVAIATTTAPTSAPITATTTMPIGPAIPPPTAGVVGGMFMGICFGVPAGCGTIGFTVAGLILLIIACKALFDAAREAQQNRTPTAAPG